MTVHLLENSV